MSNKHIVTINHESLQDTLQYESCGECQTSCQSACKTSCTIGNLVCPEHRDSEEE
jgi:predicted ribosomally synthesized six-cysteine peptide SCIFF